jgi:hypothetical protein
MWNLGRKKMTFKFKEDYFKRERGAREGGVRTREGNEYMDII